MKIYRVTATILDSTMLWKPKGIITIQAKDPNDALLKFDMFLAIYSCKAKNIKVEEIEVINGIIHEEYMANYENKSNPYASLMEGNKGLDGEISELINKNFWDLV